MGHRCYGDPHHHPVAYEYPHAVANADEYFDANRHPIAHEHSHANTYHAVANANQYADADAHAATHNFYSNSVRRV